MFAVTNMSLKTFEGAVSVEMHFSKKTLDTKDMIEVDPESLESEESSPECIKRYQELLV